MIKIAHIAKPVGGVGVYLSLLTKHTDTEKFEHMLLYNQKEVELTLDSFSALFHVPIIREISLIKDFKCLFRIISHLKKNRPDRIHCHSAKAGILGRIAGAYLKIPTFYTPHAYSYLSANAHFKRKLFKAIERFFRFFPAQTIACSPSEYDRTVNDLKFNKQKVFLWNNSIEDNLLGEDSAILQQLPEWFICSIGRPSYQKNTELLVKTVIEAKKINKNIHLVILGVGFYAPTYNHIKKMIEENDLTDTITLVPWLEREKTVEILKNSLLYISTSRYEGLPYAVIEALALSKPCIVTNVDGNKDLIKNNYNGFLLNDNPEKLAEKVIEILVNEELRKTMGQNSRKVFEEKYNIVKNINKIEQIYFE